MTERNLQTVVMMCPPVDTREYCRHIKLHLLYKTQTGDKLKEKPMCVGDVVRDLNSFTAAWHWFFKSLESAGAMSNTSVQLGWQLVTHHITTSHVSVKQWLSRFYSSLLSHVLSSPCKCQQTDGLIMSCLSHKHHWCQICTTDAMHLYTCHSTQTCTTQCTLICHPSVFFVSVLFLLFLVEVAVIIEVTEEDNEADAVTKHHQVHAVGEVALCKQVVACVQEKQQKLHLEK